MEEKDFKELLKTFNITFENDKCKEAVEVIEKTLLESVKKDMIKKIEAMKDINEMKEFALHCAKAALNDYENLLKGVKDLKDIVWNKKK